MYTNQLLVENEQIQKIIASSVKYIVCSRKSLYEWIWGQILEQKTSYSFNQNYSIILWAWANEASKEHSKLVWNKIRDCGEGGQRKSCQV